MAEYKNDKLGVSFSVPESVPVRQQLRFKSAIAASDKLDTYEQFWKGALVVIQDWKCEALPDPAVLDMDKDTRKITADVVAWVGNQVAAHMFSLEDVPKN